MKHAKKREGTPVKAQPAPQLRPMQQRGSGRGRSLFRGPGSFPRTSTVGHHVITNLQITVDKDGDTGVVRGTQTITFGTVNSAGNGGTASVVLTGRYYGLVRLTPQGWKFDLWEPIEDQPGGNPGMLGEQPESLICASLPNCCAGEKDNPIKRLGDRHI
jgi:SnoaL-like domain